MKTSSILAKYAHKHHDYPFLQIINPFHQEQRIPDSLRDITIHYKYNLPHTNIRNGGAAPKESRTNVVHHDGLNAPVRV